MLRTIFLSRESTLLVEGKVAKQDAVRRQGDEVRRAANDLKSPVAAATEKAAASGPPANDNPKLDLLAPCLPVTDEEVRLLHRYLGAQILGLFA